VPTLALDQLADAANLDPEFRLAARLWTTTLRLEADEEALLVRVVDGRITGVETAGTDEGEISVRASASEWREFLAPTPRPFYQDLWGAMSHHGFSVDGDLESLYAYYPAAQRLFALLRES
jgi:hypothetical protein